MKATEILSKLYSFPGMPWGADVYFGRPIFEVAQKNKWVFEDVTHHFDPCKQYFVVWGRVEFVDFIESLGQYDLFIYKDDLKKYCWEIF